ncbi:MAG TPA: hypothetical protein VH761_15920, partial [Ilumatobacteraceae bacterium]
MSKYEPGLQTTSVQPLRIPGGLLLNVRSSSYGYFPGSMLAVIDDDGTTRWVRCLADGVTLAFVAPVSTAPQFGIALTHVDQDNALPLTDYRMIALADGSDQGTLAQHLGDQGIDVGTDLESLEPKAASETQLLFAPPNETIIDTGRDRLLLVDLVSLTGELLPFPEFSNGTASMYNGFRFDDEGNPYLVGSENGHDIVLRSYRNGTWSDGPSELPPSSTITVDFEFGVGGTALVATDSPGKTKWRRNDIVSPGGEGFRTAPSDDVTVVVGCRGPIDNPGDCAFALYGVRTSTGKTLWTLDGLRGVSAVGDGYALITDYDLLQSEERGGWLMIDTATGRPVEGQQWPDPAAFHTECCGGGEFFAVWQLGGIVVAVAERHVSIYYPLDSGRTPHE